MKRASALSTLALVVVWIWITPSRATTGTTTNAAPPTETLSAQQAVHISVDEILASGFTNPVQLTHAGDGSGRLFVVEQPGTIAIVDQGIVLPTPFLDITSLTVASGERGLLGIAFHPDYAANGFVYVDYTRAGDGATVLARYTRSTTDPNQLNPGSATTVLTVTQPFANHNGGQITFGPDGYLYVGLGDGGGDQEANAQDPTTLLGSILRIDVDGAAPYTSPTDNPYVGLPGRDEVWAIGLRNPWRFSFDRATSDAYIGDVGEQSWEEIDFHVGWATAGSPGAVNYGWPCREGTHDYAFTPDCTTVTLTDPIAEYDHTLGRSVTGGFVYRGALYPDLVGRYFYGDFVTGRIWTLPGPVRGSQLRLWRWTRL